jgi:hypothetical protein
VLIRDSVIVTYSYELKVFNKSNYKSKPRLRSLIYMTIAFFPPISVSRKGIHTHYIHVNDGAFPYLPLAPSSIPPSKLVHILTAVTCIQEVTGSNRGQESDSSTVSRGSLPL